MKTFFLRFATLAVALFCLQGCGSSLAQPFQGMKDQKAPLTAFRLQNYSPPAQAAATTATAQAAQIPAQIQQWIQAGAAMLPPGLIPPGLVPGSTAPVAAAQQVAKFGEFPIIAQQNVLSEDSRNKLFELFGNEKNFTVPRENCLYAEFGLSVPQMNQPSADIFVSLSCNQIRTSGFSWPHGANNGLTPDATKQFVSIMQQIFGGG